MKLNKPCIYLDLGPYSRKIFKRLLTTLQEQIKLSLLHDWTRWTVEDSIRAVPLFWSVGQMYWTLRSCIQHRQERVSGLGTALT